MARRTVITRNIPALTLRGKLRKRALHDDDEDEDEGDGEGEDDDEDRIREVVFSTGEAVLRETFFDGPFMEELSMEPGHVRLDRLNSSAPLLDAHNMQSNDGVIGVVVPGTARIVDGEGIADVRFAKKGIDENADRLFDKVADGIITDVSVGYRVHTFERTDGSDGQIPVQRAVDWEPFEISIAPIGQDSGAQFRAADAQTNPCEFVRNEPEEPNAMAKKDPTNTPTPTPAVVTAVTPIDVNEVRADAKKHERERIESIGRIGTGLGLPADIAKRAIDADTTVEAFRALAIDEHAKLAKPSPIEPGGRVEVVPGGDVHDKKMRAMENWLIVRSGKADLMIAFAKSKGETIDLDPGEYRGMSLVDLARECLGPKLSRGVETMQMIGRAFVGTRAGYQTISDFPVLLENTLHKMLLAQYGITPDTWSRFCDVGSVSDFRVANRYRMGTFGSLDLVAESGEFTNKVMPDARKETIQAATRGNIVAISRQTIINDDMSALTRTATMLGRAAALSIEVAVYALLAENAGLGPNMNDGNPLFDASHDNLGAGAALSVASIDENRVVMASQQDESGNEVLDLRPSVLLVPIGLGGQAKKVNEARFNIDAGSLFEEPNEVLGLFNDVVDTARLSGTRRYLFASNEMAPTIEVAFLQGQRSPFMETKDGFRIDGVEWKVRHDFGVSAVDFRGAVTDAGA